jgi:hypothetical protein
MSDAFQNDPLAAAQTAYSPLPQMVQRFRETWSGGRPAPRPIPTIEEQQQETQPDHSKIPEWNQPRRQTLAAPAGAPTPRQAQFAPFVGASIPRPSHQWGAEEQFPKLPQPFEAPHIAKGLSGYFSQNGSNPAATIAGALGMWSGTFMEGYQQGREEKMKLAREQMALHIEALKVRAEEEMTRYSDVIAAHGALNETGDVRKMIKPVNGKTVMEDLYDTAVSIGDVGKPGTLGDLIASGAMPSDVIKFLEARDNRTRDLQKLKATVDGDSAEESKWGLATPQKTGDDEAGRYSGLREPGSPAVASAAPTPSVDPVTGDKVAGPGAPSARTQDHDPEDPFAPGSPGEEAVTDVMRGSDMNAQVAKRHPGLADAVYREAARRNQKMADLIQNPPKDPSQILPAVKRINPAIGSDVEQVLNYQMPASGGVSGTGASPGTKAGQYSDRLRNLAHLIDPKWNQGFYQDQQRFRVDISTQTTLARTKDLAAMADRINTDLRIIENDLKKRGLSTTNVNMEGIMSMFANDPKYVGLHTDFLAYNDAYNTIVSGGRHTVTGAREQTSAISSYAPLATYRNVIKGHMSGVDGMIDAVRSRWRSYGGKDEDMPSGDDRNSAEAFQAIKDYKLMDYVTGARPMKDVVVHNGVRAVWTGKNQIDRNAPENWKAAD